MQIFTEIIGNKGKLWFKLQLRFGPIITTKAQILCLIKALNRALLYDELECLEKWIVLVRLNAHWLNRSETRINEDTVVWRGSKLTHEQAARLQENAIIRPPILLPLRTAESKHINLLGAMDIL